jgi:hypothetical protein
VPQKLFIVTSFNMIFFLLDVHSFPDILRFAGVSGKVTGVQVLLEVGEVLGLGVAEVAGVVVVFFDH